MARPTKLTPQSHKAIVDALALGATRKDAAGAAGVDYRTFINWMDAGSEAKAGMYFQFFQAVSRAESDARLKFTLTITKAAQSGDWRAALEYLQRRDPDNWSTRQTLKIDISKINELTDDELRQIIES